MIRDDRNNMGVAFAIAPATLDADNTPGAVDLRGYDSATILVNVGVGGITFDATNKVEFKLTHSDDNVTYTAVTVTDVTGLDSVGTGGIIRSLTAAHAAATSTRVGYIGGKRYIKVLADFSGTHGTGTPIDVPVVLTRAHQLPVA
jgi:hypothetical protein